MKGAISGIGFLIVLAAPLVALAWLVYRLVRGNKRSDYFIK